MYAQKTLKGGFAPPALRTPGFPSLSCCLFLAAAEEFIRIHRMLYVIEGPRAPASLKPAGPGEFGKLFENTGKPRNPRRCGARVKPERARVLASRRRLLPRGSGGHTVLGVIDNCPARPQARVPLAR